MKKKIKLARPARFVFLGPQGSGKGTQAEMLSEELKIPRVSPGDILRREAAKKTKSGRLVASCIDRGDLVPEDMIYGIISKRISEKDCKKGFILDGYPRNMIQAENIEKVTDISYAVFIDISDQEAISRISGRRVCACGMTYHLKFNPPKRNGICDKCGKRLSQRKDDRKRAIEKRLKIYHKQTEPLVPYYEKNGVLVRINGKQPIAKVYEDIISKLSK